MWSKIEFIDKSLKRFDLYSMVKYNSINYHNITDDLLLFFLTKILWKLIKSWIYIKVYDGYAHK